jgi:hypothetical protein
MLNSAQKNNKPDSATPGSRGKPAPTKKSTSAPPSRARMRGAKPAADVTEAPSIKEMSASLAKLKEEFEKEREQRNYFQLERVQKRNPQISFNYFFFSRFFACL